MSKFANGRQCGTSVGLALLFSLSAQGELLLPESNYVLIEDKQHPEASRLLIMRNSDDEFPPPTQPSDPTGDDEQRAVVMVTSVSARDRVRGLTLLAGNDSFAALETALVLMTDHDSRVREEALHVLFEHPRADRQFIIKLGSDDASASVRKATAALVEEASGD